MEINWSTFVLEIINFLILVWILKRFLYKPVLDVIARRRAEIEKTRVDAEALHTNANKLQEQYEGRLADWEQERQQARDSLGQEIEFERVRKMAELQTSLAQEREKARVAEARRQADIIQKIEEIALIHGAHFASQLLEQAAGPDTETRLIELVTIKLTQLPAEQITTLRNNYEKSPETIVVVTAYPLSDEQRQRLEQALVAITSPGMSLRFEQNSELLAGVYITIGAWVLAANIRDELKGFVELTHYE